MTAKTARERFNEAIAARSTPQLAGALELLVAKLENGTQLTGDEWRVHAALCSELELRSPAAQDASDEWLEDGGIPTKQYGRVILEAL